tara:strand:- start:780 stop:1541 length:762 start_codon:yes stop_codon:yes gene_type:complete
MTFKKEKINFSELLRQKRESRKSRLVLGIWGEPKTGKTGLALDFPDRKIFVLDWDRGVESTWFQHHDATDRIEVFCPIVMTKDNIIDINESEDRSLQFIDHAKKSINDGEKPIFVIDGVDTWLASCMLKVNPNPRVVTKIMPYMYGNRNKAFYYLLNTIYNLECDVIFITHETEKYMDGVPVGMQPMWKEWGGKLEQEIYCSKKMIKGQLHFFAELLGSRTNGKLVGSKWTTRQGTPPNITWNGLKELKEGTI